MEPLLSFFKTIPPWMLILGGGLLGSLRQVWSTIYSHTVGYLIKKGTISLTIEDKNHPEAFKWIASWLETRLAQRKITSLLLKTSDDEDEDDSNSFEAWSSKYSLPKNEGNGYRLIPSYGTYYMMWRNRPIMIDHSITPSNNNPANRLHTLSIQIWFSRDRQLALDLIKEAQDEYRQASNPKIEFNTVLYQSWKNIEVAPRDMASIYLPETLVSDISADLKKFLESKEKIQSLGCPYRRGYLFFGPPGTGKSSTILALASKFNLKIYLFPILTEKEDMNDLLQKIPKNSILLIEDVDCFNVAVSRDSSTTSNMATLLNAIDGIGAMDSRILIITSNHPDKLDPALVRAGRIDRRFHFDFAADKELEVFYNRVKAVEEDFRFQSFIDFRNALPTLATIGDAQALAFQGDTYVENSNRP